MTTVRRGGGVYCLACQSFYEAGLGLGTGCWDWWLGTGGGGGDGDGDGDGRVSVQHTMISFLCPGSKDLG